jgi:hypothetical protein
MSFSPKAHSSLIRVYYDDYVPRPKGAEATDEEIAVIPKIGVVADILGMKHRDVSDTAHRSKGLGFIKVGESKWYSTDVHFEGWDTEKARQALREHLAGRQQVELKIKKAPARARKAVQLTFEDWSLFHLWEAICLALEELGASGLAERQDVSKKIRPKLEEHGVPDTERVGAILPLIQKRLEWVDIGGADTWSGWYLTEKYFQTSPLERARILSQWDEKGDPVALPQPIYEEKPIALPTGNLVAIDNEVVVVHHFEWDGAPFGVLNAHVTVEARLPIEPPAEERLGLFQFIMKLREDLLNLI